MLNPDVISLGLTSYVKLLPGAMFISSGVIHESLDRRNCWSRCFSLIKQVTNVFTIVGSERIVHSETESRFGILRRTVRVIKVECLKK